MSDQAASDRAVMADDLQRGIRRLAALTVVLFVLLAGLGAYVYVRLSDISDRGARAHTAVCVLRADEIARVAAARAFIAEHPGGFAGITVESLQQTINSQERTIAALAIADCPD